MANKKTESLDPCSSGNSCQDVDQINEEMKHEGVPDNGSPASIPGEEDEDGSPPCLKVESCLDEGPEKLDDSANNRVEEPVASNEVLNGDYWWMDDTEDAREADLTGGAESGSEVSETASSSHVTSEASPLASGMSQDGAMEEAVVDEKPFVCKHCGYKCRKACRLRDHMMKHSGERPFACKMCDYRSSRRDILKQHMLSHLSQKPYTCEVCDYKTNTAGKLKRHVNTHFEEMPFACEFCDYKCTLAQLLKKHIMIHTGEKPFRCDVCDYRCSQAGRLTRHKLTHSECEKELKVTCELCDFRTTQFANLKIHMRKHTGEKPYFCDYCDYRCNSSSQMTKHKRTHTGETPYACNMCEFKCKQPDNLRVHMRKHTGERPFSCDFCGLRFCTKGVLKRHLERKHLKDTDPSNIPKHDTLGVNTPEDLNESPQ